MELSIPEHIDEYQYIMYNQVFDHSAHTKEYPALHENPRKSSILRSIVCISDTHTRPYIEHIM